jgi:intracellular sulfur oxidation DsrE/DsrF family protein
MNGNHGGGSVARRLFLTRLGMAAGVVGASVSRGPEAQAQSAIDVRWQPARHAQDDWLDKIPGQHRFVFDSTSADGLSMALQFANNYYSANQSGYDLQDKDLAVVIVVRHKSTSFGYTDAMWAKYGKYLSDHANFVDPKTKEAPTVNVHGTSGNGSGQAGRLDGLLKRGVNLAVCQMATRNIAGIIARGTGATQDAIFSELGANLVNNARLVPAGIVAVNRAQERGYTFVYAA